MRRFWDARARENAKWFIHSELSYQHPDDAEFWRSGEDSLERTLALFEVGFDGTERVLDLGCGIGRITRALARRAAFVVGVDVSEEMIARGRGALADLSNVELAVGNGRDLRDWEDESFDVVYSFIVFQHIPDPAVTCGYIVEIGRVLRPGGWTIFQLSERPDIHTADHWASTETLAIRLKRRLGRAPRGVAEAPWLGSAVPRSDLLAALDAADLALAGTVGDDSQFCIILAHRPPRREDSAPCTD